jgi:hypothetical protein
MGWLRSYVLIASLILNCEVAFGQDYTTANGMMPGCRRIVAYEASPNTSAAYDTGMCAGIIGTLFYFGSALGFCSPERANRGQALRVVVQYIDARPARMHERFQDLALEALKAAWPCNR